MYGSLHKGRMDWKPSSVQFCSFHPIVGQLASNCCSERPSGSGPRGKRISMAKALDTESVNKLGLFWWVFALRGAFAVLFAIVLFTAGSLFRVFFLDPFLITLLGLLLGFYVMANGLLLGVAAVVADDHAHPHWWMLLSESIAVIVLGFYIGFTLLLTPQSLALLAGLHALIAGGFQCMRAIKIRHDARSVALLGIPGVIFLCAGAAFLAHQDAAVRNITNWLATLELFYGVLGLLFALTLYRERPQISSK